MSNEPYRVLLVTENADDGALAALVLEQCMTDVQVLQAGGALDFADRLAAGDCKAVVVDSALNWADGEAVAEAVKRRYPDCVVLLFGEGSEPLGGSRHADAVVPRTSRGFLDLPKAIESAGARLGTQEEQPREIAAYERLVAQLPVGIFATSTNGSFRAANEAVLETLGMHSAEQVLGKQLPDLIADVDTRLRCRALLERAQPQKDLETVVRRADGGTARVSLSFWPLLDEHDRALSYEGVMWDLSLLGLDRGLEVDQLASAVSHDLQDPLQLINQYANLLIERHGSGLEEDAARLVTRVSESAMRMQSMIDGILEFSRISAGERPFQAVDMNAVVDTALRNLETQISAQGAIVDCPPLPTVIGEPRLLSRLLQNLIGNAVKFRGVAPPRISVSIEERPDDWLAQVTDNGIGIDPRAAERIFDMFQRLHTTEEYPGTGLGLSICKRIAECHGGRIWVDSRPGEGATFFVTVSKDLQRKPPGSAIEQAT